MLRSCLAAETPRLHWYLCEPRSTTLSPAISRQPDEVRANGRGAHADRSNQLVVLRLKGRLPKDERRMYSHKVLVGNGVPKRVTDPAVTKGAGNA
jgi:hypothetical protein